MTWLVEIKAAVLLGWFAAIFVLERLVAAATRPPGHGRIVRNLLLWVIMIILSPLLVLPIAYWASAQALWSRPDAPIALWLITDLLVLDLLTYLLHIAYHRVPAMWRLHGPHHLDRFLDSTTALRFHFGEVLLSAILRAPLVIALAVPFAHIVLFELALTAASIFYHSNIRLTPSFEQALSRVMVTPSIHWVHHHRCPEDTNSNYGAILSLWDRLFQTKSATQRWPDMEIGAPDIDEKPLIGLLLAPVTGLKKS
ncbi:MAG: sterol desaturase family protein [Parvularculaceae bacterium]